MDSHQPPGRDALVDCSTLAARLGDPALRVFDTNVILRRGPAGLEIESGRAGYEAAHVPGAAFMDLLVELSDRSSPLSFTLPPEPQLVACWSACGIGPGTRVVLYSSGSVMWATRAWYMLRAFGFDAAQVLDGGLERWRAEGHPVEAGTRRYAPASFVVTQRRPLFVGKREVLEAVTGGGAVVVNSLGPDVHSGRVSTYKRRGRIAGSLNVPATDLLDPATQTFLPPDRLAARYDAAGVRGDRPVITYCGGGIAATTGAFALHLAGREDVAIYDGSLNEWSADPSLPMEVDG